MPKRKRQKDLDPEYQTDETIKLDEKDPDPEYKTDETIKLDKKPDRSDYEPVSKRTRLGGNGFPGALKEPDDFELELPDKEVAVATVAKSILDPPVPAPFRFLDLPAEVRNMVYKIWHKDLFRNDLKVPFGLLRNRNHCNIRLVSKQINQEWMPYFLQGTSISIYYGCNRRLYHGRLQDRWHSSSCWKYFEPLWCDPCGWECAMILKNNQARFPVPVDSVLGTFDSVALSNLGAVEHRFMISLQNHWPNMRDLGEKCVCSEIFAYGRRHLQEGRPGKLLMQIACSARHYNCYRAFNKVLLFDKTHPEDYSTITQKTWRECESVAAAIVSDSLSHRRWSWNKRPTDKENMFGKLVVRFTKIDQNSTPDPVDGYFVEYPAEGVTVADIFRSPTIKCHRNRPLWCENLFPRAYR